MKKYVQTIIPLFVFLFTSSQLCFSETLHGETGSSSKWGSGWLDLEKMSDFEKGEKILVHVGGTANKILVRLLKKGADPDQPIGIEGGAHTVPNNRIVEVVLERNHENIVQISVHGGPNPWGRFPLGGGNGPATITDAEYIKP